ncbi:MAG: gephyrin-like molybdotransferase Glp [Coriobacteriales bacterium]
MNVPAPISVEEARAIVKEHVKPLGSERVPVLEAVGRVLAEDVFSDIDVCPFDDSGMDGFAIVAADLEDASAESPVQLRCVAHIGAGSVYEQELQRGECARIMTGAPVPAGADAVVQIEKVAFEGEGSIGDAIAFSEPVKLGMNIRHAGEEAKVGDKICEAGEYVTPAGAGLFAACGNLEVSVYKRPVAGLISIGSELVDASAVPGPGMIRNSNIWAMQANVVAAGAVPKVYPTVSDDVEEIRAVYAQAAQECDIVFSTGGACLGDFDLTPGILRELGTMLFERVNVKPGKSQPFGFIGSTPVFVLSGNPAASSVGFELYGRLALRIMEGFTALDRPSVKAKIGCDVKRRSDGRMMLERAILSQNADGELEVMPLKKQSSALYGALQKCNCLCVIPEGGNGIKAGELAECILTCADEILPLSC